MAVIRNGCFTSIVFSNGSRRKLLADVDAFGCLRSLRARSALDGVSWVQRGSLKSQSAIGWLRATESAPSFAPSLGVAPCGSWFRPPVSWLVACRP